MKSRLLFIFTALCFANFSLIAQPTFTSVTLPANGTILSGHSGDYTGGNDYLTAGANISWDFSTYTFGTTAETATYYSNLSEALYGTDFPTANAFTRGSEGDENFEINSSTSLVTIGGVDKQSGTHFYYTDNDIQLSLPFAYNTTHNDTYAYNYSGSGLTTYVTGTRSTSYDGYGTLVLPTETIENVIRMKTLIDETQTVNFGGTDHTFGSKVTMYSWLVAGEYNSKLDLVTVEQYEEGVLQGTTKSISLTDPESIATGFEKSTTAQTVSLFPQPANELVYIQNEKLEGLCVITVMNTNGLVIKTTELYASSGQALSLNIQDLPAGIHVLEITNQGNKYRNKLMVK